jgi:hypothetical protein
VSDIKMSHFGILTAMVYQNIKISTKSHLDVVADRIGNAALEQTQCHPLYNQSFLENSTQLEQGNKDAGMAPDD